MKKKPTTKAAVSGFVPSTGNEAYLQTATESLSQVADEINRKYDEGTMLRVRTTETFIEVGRLLNDARKLFTSDVKFGVWRKQSISFSQSHVQRLMQVAREFGDIKDASTLPFGTLAVLTSATEDLKEKVIAEAKEGEAPTRAEVIERKKEESVKPVSAEEAAAAMEQPDEEEYEPPVTEPDEEWVAAQVILDMPFHRRIHIVDIEASRNPFHASCLLYGIPPFHDGQPSSDLVSNLYSVLCKEDCITDALHDKLTAAHDVLMSVIKLA